VDKIIKKYDYKRISRITKKIFKEVMPWINQRFDDYHVQRYFYGNSGSHEEKKFKKRCKK